MGNAKKKHCLYCGVHRRPVPHGTFENLPPIVLARFPLLFLRRPLIEQRLRTSGSWGTLKKKRLIIVRVNVVMQKSNVLPVGRTLVFPLVQRHGAPVGAHHGVVAADGPVDRLREVAGSRVFAGRVADVQILAVHLESPTTAERRGRGELTVESWGLTWLCDVRCRCATTFAPAKNRATGDTGSPADDDNNLSDHKRARHKIALSCARRPRLDRDRLQQKVQTRQRARTKLKSQIVG